MITKQRKKRILEMNKYGIECSECGALFIPGGREMTTVCAGCFKKVLEETRSVMITISHIGHGNYDWNADPKYLTRLEGDTFSIIDRLLDEHR